MATASTKENVGDFEVDLNKELGKGAFGVVYVARHISSKTDVAAKRIEWLKDFETAEVDNEANMLRRIPPHPNVLKIIDYIKKEVVKETILLQGWMILELCTLGNMAQYAEETPLSIAQKVDLVLQGSRGVQHLHRQTPRIIHRNIKLQSLLVTGSESNPVVKVGSFSIACESDDAGYGGPMAYMAPEMHRIDKYGKVQYNQSVDVFGMGVSAMTLIEAHHGTRISAFTGMLLTVE